MRSNLCSKCKKVKEIESKRYCRGCANEWMRINRKPLVGEARKKANIRNHTKMCVKRGMIEKLPCENCGTTEKVEAHHDDYSKYLEVRWLCFKHHREHHKNLKEQNSYARS